MPCEYSEMIQFSSVQSLSRVRLAWTAAHQAISNSLSLLKLMSLELVMTSDHLILCHPFLLPPSVFPRSGCFQWVSSSHQMAKVLEFQLQHQSFQNISTSFKVVVMGNGQKMVAFLPAQLWRFREPEPEGKALLWDCQFQRIVPEVTNSQHVLCLLISSPLTFIAWTHANSCNSTLWRVMSSVGGGDPKEGGWCGDHHHQESWSPGDFSKLFHPRSSNILWVHSAWHGCRRTPPPSPPRAGDSPGPSVEGLLSGTSF